MSLDLKLQPYINAVQDGIKQKNWILVTAGALTLPDICSSLTSGNGQSSRHMYIDWFDNYCRAYKFTYFEYNEPMPSGFKEYMDWRQYRTKVKVKKDGKYKHVLHELEHFNGLLAYALRCGFLHNGSGQVSNQKIHQEELKSKTVLPEDSKTLGIDKIVLDISMEDKVIGRSNDVVYLNPKHFAEEIIEGVYDWIDAVGSSNTTVYKNLGYFIEVKDK